MVLEGEQQVQPGVGLITGYAVGVTEFRSRCYTNVHSQRADRAGVGVIIFVEGFG